MLKYRYIILTTLLLFLSFYSLRSQKISNYVIGSGGTQVRGSTVIVNGTVGQSMIGLVKKNKIVHGCGFWYCATPLANPPDPYFYISLPKRSAEIGDTVQLPLTLNESKNWEYAFVKNFVATIRYNSTVIQPIGNTPNCETTDNDDCLITINGSMNDSAGVLFNMEFLVRLGNVEFTPLIIESFKWIESDRGEIFTENGELEILGICKEGETNRYVKFGTKEGLQSISPNPSSDNILINYTIREKGETKIVVINNLGKEAAVLFEGLATVGHQSLFSDVSTIPTGLYNIILTTPTQIFSKKILITR